MLVWDEIILMGELIATMKDLKSLTLTCNDVNEIPKISANAKKVNKTERGSIPISKFFTDTNKLWKGVAKLLIRSTSMQKLTLEGTWLSNGSWDVLFKGMAGNKSLRILKINHCRLGGTEVARMVPSLLHDSFVSLDVANNRIDDDGARSLAHLIAWHSDQRDMEVYN